MYNGINQAFAANMTTPHSVVLVLAILGVNTVAPELVLSADNGGTTPFFATVLESGTLVFNDLIVGDILLIVSGVDGFVDNDINGNLILVLRLGEAFNLVDLELMGDVLCD